MINIHYVSHLSPKKEGYEAFCLYINITLLPILRKKIYPYLRARNYLVYIGSDTMPHITCFTVVQRGDLDSMKHEDNLLVHQR